MTFASVQKAAVRPLDTRRDLLAAGVRSIPEQIAGLVTWLHASDLDAYGNGNPIDAWPNRAAPEMFMQPVTASRPLYQTNILNSLPGVLFDGSNDHLDGTISRTLKPFTAFVVLEWNSLSGNQYIIGHVGSLASATGNLDTDTTSLRLVTEGVSVVGTASTAAATATPQLRDVSYSGVGAFLFGKDGSDDGSGTNDDTVNAGAVCIGARGSSERFFSGYMHEIIVYDSVLSTGDRQIVRDYLTSEWAV